MTVELRIADPRWEAVGLPAMARSATNTTLAHLGMVPDAWAIGMLATNDAEIVKLNKDFRGNSVPTNVLSWPSALRSPDLPGNTPTQPDPADPELGDIALAFETCAREADTAQLALADHMTHLVVHGTLHLLGYDHTHDADAALMERLEIEILASLGVADPY